MGNKKKVIIIGAGTAGAGNTPTRGEGVGKWVNTSGQIDVLQWFKSSSQTVPAGTTIKVWGSN